MSEKSRVGIVVAFMLALTAPGPSMGQQTPACAAQTVLDNCLQIATILMSACAPADSGCSCHAQQARATCYNNCPNDPASGVARDQVQTYCGNANLSACSPPVGSRIALKADTGGYYTRCTNCQKSVASKIADTVTVSVTAPTGPAVFTVVDAGGGKKGLKADNGKYVARCNGCIVGAPSDMLTVHATAPSPFTFEKTANGKCVLKADNGKYAGRCRGCTTGAPSLDVVSVKDVDSTQSFVQFVVAVIK